MIKENLSAPAQGSPFEYPRPMQRRATHTPPEPSRFPDERLASV